MSGAYSQSVHRRSAFTYLAAGLLLALSEVWKQLVLTFVVGQGSYQWSFIPFQLCSLPMYISVIIGCLEFTGRMRRFAKPFKVFLADFSLMSGIIVLLDQTGMHYGLMPLTMHSYLWHAAITLLGVYAGIDLIKNKPETDSAADFVQISAGEDTKCGICPAAGDFIPAACIYLIGCVIAEIINLNFDKYGVVNMFYINPHYYMEQIVFRDLRDVIPNNAVIALYIMATLAGGFIVHLTWAAAGRTAHKWKTKA